MRGLIRMILIVGVLTAGAEWVSYAFDTIVHEVAMRTYLRGMAEGVNDGKIACVPNHHA